MATLKQAIKQIQDDVRTEQLQRIGMSHIVIAGASRSYPSATMAYDGNTSFDPSSVGINNTVRPNWRTGTWHRPELTQTQGLPTPVSAAGSVVSPSTTNPVFVAVPDMTIPVRGQKSIPVQISWNLSASLSTLTASAMFALYRDGQKVGQTLYGQSPSNNQKFSVSQTFLDNPGVGLHAYSVYWATTAGTLTADGKGRLISAMVLNATAPQAGS